MRIIFEKTKQVVDIKRELTQSDINRIYGMGYSIYNGNVEEGYDGNIYAEGYAPKKTLEELKLAKRAEINQARDKAEQGGFEYLGKTFDSDQISAQRISMAAQAMALAPEGTTITWTCQDNTTIDLTAQELVGLVVALATWSNACHEKATALKAKIEAAQTAEELELITWEDNPATL